MDKSNSNSLEQKVQRMDKSIGKMLPCSFHKQLCSSSEDRVAIFWDMENCPVPRDVCPEDVKGNITKALWEHALITGPITTFSAYGDFNAFPHKITDGCLSTGITLIDIPNGRKDAADKTIQAILADILLFALDNSPPSSIMLISGHVDFARTLHILVQRGYTTLLVIPSGVHVSYALKNANKFVWDWTSVACGEKIVSSCVGPTEVAGVTLAKLKQERSLKALSEIAEQQTRALPEELMNRITEMGGTELTLIIQKRLFKTDLSKQHSRLSMPLKKLRNADFLREREALALLNGEPMIVPLLLPSMLLQDIALALWDIEQASGRTSSVYLLKKSWNKVVEACQLNKGDIVQVWSFRFQEKLHMALVKPRF